MPAATAARPAEANPPAETESRHNEGDGLFGPIRIGPMVGVGLPHALSFGGTIKLTRYLGGGINVGLIPNSHISFYGKATLSSQEYDIYGRIYPFGGGFFLGAGVGYETVRGTLASSIDGSDIAKMYPQLNLPSSLEYASSGSVRTMVLTPQIGYFQSLGAGFHLGIDFGAQIPIAPSEITFERQANVPKEYEGALEPIDVEVRHSLEIIGQTTIPTVNLKLAWLL